LIIDGFLSNYNLLKDYSLSCVYQDEINEVDGVTYPLICKDIPAVVETEVLEKASQIINKEIKQHTIFLRQSPKGVDCPHQCHSDISMGDHSLMLYLNTRSDGGTSLVHHIPTGEAYNPIVDSVVEAINKDVNDHTSWIVDGVIEMKENRAFIFPSDRFHRAEPIGGFGAGEEARTVLTCFFS